jgi:hypothetical protein
LKRHLVALVKKVEDEEPPLDDTDDDEVIAALRANPKAATALSKEAEEILVRPALQQTAARVRPRGRAVGGSSRRDR